MKILVLGSGAREHALVRALSGEQVAHELWCAPGSDALAAAGVATCSLEVTDPAAVCACVRAHDIELVVIGPEAPLIAGVADAVRRVGVPVFGPGRQAAQIEGSKSFAKRVMRAAGIPTARELCVSSLAQAEQALDRFDAPYVVKADGLAAGKGVLVTVDRDAALAHAATWLRQGEVLIEEFLTGTEVSLFFFADGHDVVALSPAQDYKRAFDGDAGPNTGGMGAYSPLPWLPSELITQITEQVAVPTVRQLEREGTPFIGLLYCGLIVTAAGIRVIEFNARFGDPETQAILPRLRSPLSDYLLAAATGQLAGVVAPAFSDEAAVAVVLASEGYPGAPHTGARIDGLDADGELVDAVPGVHLVHAGTARDHQGRWVATGGRVLGVVACAATVTQARERVYLALQRLSLAGGHYRRDIAESVE